MNNRLILLLLLFLVGGSIQTAWAQFVSWEDYVAAQWQREEVENPGYVENFIEEMAAWHEHPIDINSATRADLEQFPFLTPTQVEDILFYIDYYGALHGVGELQLIPSLDYDTRQLLSFLVCFGPSPEKEPEKSLHDWLTKGKSEVTSRMDVPFYTRAGYEPFTLAEWESSPSQHYWGNNLYGSVRYSYRFGNHLMWGLSAEKDGGEPFFTRGNQEWLGKQGFDHYNGYVRLRDRGQWRDAVIGCYRLSFGLGLVMNNNFSLGKSMAMSNMERAVTASPISSHGGTGEAGYLRGAAATVRLDDVDVTLFVSYRRQDATLSCDSVVTILSTGLHRTSLEIDKRGNTGVMVMGGHATYHVGAFHLGATSAWQLLDRAMTPGAKPYRRYYPEGRRFMNLGADYAWYSRYVSFLGETAWSSNGGWAMLNTLRAEPFERVYLTLLQRHYSIDYWGLQANAFGESSEVRNERGIYMGVDMQNVRHWRFTAYADLFRFPWQRYQVSEPSQGADLSASALWTPGDAFRLLARYRCKLKERDVASAYRTSFSGLFREVTQRVRLQADTQVNRCWNLQSTADYCQANAEQIGYGLRLAQRVTWTASEPSLLISRCSRLSLDVEGAWFRTSDYNARIYGYERGLLYAYNYRTYYGHGIRGMLMGKCTFADRLVCAVKVGWTHYFDREMIGSGAQLIPQNHAEDMALQIRYKF